jgi:hypothetical protein
MNELQKLLANVPPEYTGFKSMIIGPTGTGKTRSIGTLVDLGLEVFYIALEPGLETLVGYFTDPKPEGQGLDTLPPNFHWHIIKANTQKFKEMKATAENIGKFDLSAIAKMRDPNRAANNQMLPLYECLNDFTDQRDGKKYGPVDSMGQNCVVVIDGLSALCRIAMEMVTGAKPVRDKPDYGIYAGNVSNLLLKLTSGCVCHFVILAHVDREVDEVMGGVKLFPSVLGNSLRANLTQPFSDVILATRETSKFFWDTANTQADLKTRNLPISSRIEPNFDQIFLRWAGRASASGKAV